MLPSRRRFLRHAAAASAGAAAIINNSCSCDCGGVFDSFLLGLAGSQLDKTLALAILDQQQKDCEEEEKQERSRSSPFPFVSPGSTSAPTVANFRSSRLHQATNRTFTPSKVGNFQFTNFVGAVSPNSRSIYTLDNYSDPRVRVLDAATLAVTADLPVPGGTSTRGIALAPDRSAIYLVRRFNPALPASLIALNPANNTFTTVAELPGTFALNTLAISPNGRFAITQATDAGLSFVLFDIPNRRVHARIPYNNGTGVPNFVFSPDSTLAFGNFAGGVEVIDVEAGALITTSPRVRGSNGPIAISPYGDRLYLPEAILPGYASDAAAPRGFALLNTSSFQVTGYIPYSSPGQSRPVNSIAMPDGEDILFVCFRNENGYGRFSPVSQTYESFSTPAIHGSLETYYLTFV